jgi:type III secretion system YscD/HrpQ family protein
MKNMTSFSCFPHIFQYNPSRVGLDVGRRMGYILKVLSGLHQGVEVDLEDSLVIGSSSDCDLVLSDSLLQARHFSLQLKDEDVWVHPMAGKVFVDGHIIKEDLQVKIFQFITVGTTHFVFGPSEAQWPEISLKDAPLLMESSEKAEAAIQEVPTDGVSSSDALAVNHPKKTKRIIIAWLGFFLIIILFVVFYFTSPVTVLPKGVLSSSVHSRIRSEIEFLGWKDEVQTKISKDGKFSLKGYVPTNTDLVSLREKIHAIDSSVLLKVYSTEKILQQGLEILVVSKVKAKLRELQVGSFVVEGYAFNADQWEKVKTHLLSEVAGLKDVQDRIYTPMKALTTGRIILTKYKLIGSVGIFPKEEAIIVSGTIAQSEKGRWEDARSEILKTFTEAVPVQFLVTMAIAESGVDGEGKRRYFEDEVSGIVFKEGGLNYVELKNGKKYFEGSDLPNGCVVNKIETESITLLRSGNEITLKKGEY